MSDNFDFTEGAGRTIRAIDTGSGTLVQVGRLAATYSQDGANNYRVMSAASVNATNIKASAAAIWGWSLYNTNAAVRWLKIYNKASAPTVGSDTPAFTIALKPGDTTRLIIPFATPLSIGLAFGLTTGVLDSDSTGVALNEITGTILWT